MLSQLKMLPYLPIDVVDLVCCRFVAGKRAMKKCKKRKKIIAFLCNFTVVYSPALVWSIIFVLFSLPFKQISDQKRKRTSRCGRHWSFLLRSVGQDNNIIIIFF
jgi:hypothetical protein